MEQTLINKEYLLELAQKAQSIQVSDSYKAKVLEALEQMDIPTPKDELWRKSKIKYLLEQKFQITESKQLSKKDFNALEKLPTSTNTLVFYNGNFQAHLSNIEQNTDYIFSPISEQLVNSNFVKNTEKTSIYKENIFSALAAAYPQNGAFMYIKKNKYVEKPFHLVLIDGSPNANVFSQLNNLFVIESGAQAQIIVSQLSTHNGGFENTNTEVIVGENANFEQSIIQNKTGNSFNINTIKVEQKASSNYKQNTFSLKSKLIRNNTIVDFEGENATAKLNGLYVPVNQEHFDNYLLVNHNNAHCNSDQIYKGIADDKSTAIFFGKVYVAPDAQQTYANQSNKNLLLSDFAKISSKPQLEIYADDVACSHGSTTGQLDQDAIFFMQTRGISKKSAIKLLLFAFAADILEDIKNTELKEYINELLQVRFNPLK